MPDVNGTGVDGITDGVDGNSLGLNGNLWSSELWRPNAGAGLGAR